MIITRGDGLVTTAQAARIAQRSPVTIRSWARVGHLHPRGLDEQGRPLYHPDEVAEVEKERRDNGLKASRGRLDPRNRGKTMKRRAA